MAIQGYLREMRLLRRPSINSGFLAMTVERGEKPLNFENLTFNFLILTLMK